MRRLLVCCASTARLFRRRTRRTTQLTLQSPTYFASPDDAERGIIDAAERGVVTATGVMANAYLSDAHVALRDTSHPVTH